MNKFHVTSDGAKECTANIKTCPYAQNKTVQNHYNTFEDAQKEFERRNNTFVKIAKRKQTLSDRILTNGNGILKYGYPEEVLRNLGDFLENKPFTSLVIIPAGSQLYNSQLPWKNIHDYDFTVFTTPQDKKAKAKQYLDNKTCLDVLTVDITKLNEVARRSVPITEAFYAYKMNEIIYQDDNNMWKNYIKNLNIPHVRFFDVLDDTIRSKKQDYHEPVKEGTEDFRSFKHVVRYTIYQQRWGKNGPNFINPRLDEHEREAYLETLKSGRLETLFKFL